MGNNAEQRVPFTIKGHFLLRIPRPRPQLEARRQAEAGNLVPLHTLDSLSGNSGGRFNRLPKTLPKILPKTLPKSLPSILQKRGTYSTVGTILIQ